MNTQMVKRIFKNYEPQALGLVVTVVAFGAANTPVAAQGIAIKDNQNTTNSSLLALSQIHQNRNSISNLHNFKNYVDNSGILAASPLATVNKTQNSIPNKDTERLIKLLEPQPSYERQITSGILIFLMGVAVAYVLWFTKATYMRGILRNIEFSTNTEITTTHKLQE